MFAIPFLTRKYLCKTMQLIFICSPQMLGVHAHQTFMIVVEMHSSLSALNICAFCLSNKAFNGPIWKTIFERKNKNKLL